MYRLGHPACPSFVIQDKSRAADLRWSPTVHRLGFLLPCKCMCRGNEGIFLFINSDNGWSGVAGVCDDTWLSSLHLPIHHVLAMTFLVTLSPWSWSCRSRHHACHRFLGSSPAWDLPAGPLCPCFVPFWALDTPTAGAELPFAAELGRGAAEIGARQRHQEASPCDHSIALLKNQPPEVKASYRRKSNN